MAVYRCRLTQLVFPRLILGVPVRVGTAAILGGAYFLLYTLMGHLADVLPDFAWPFALAAALWMQVFYLLLLVYVCNLLVRARSTRPDSAHSAHSPR